MLKRAPKRYRFPLLIAIFLHLCLFIFLIVEFRKQNTYRLNEASNPQIIQATAIQAMTPKASVTPPQKNTEVVEPEQAPLAEEPPPTVPPVPIQSLEQHQLKNKPEPPLEEKKVEPIPVDQAEEKSVADQKEAQEHIEALKIEQERKLELEEKVEEARKKEEKIKQIAAEKAAQQKKLAAQKKIEQEKIKQAQLKEAQLKKKQLEKIQLQKKQKELAAKQKKTKLDHLAKEQAALQKKLLNEQMASEQKQLTQIQGQQQHEAESAAAAGEVDQYKAQIIQAIQANWIVPENTDSSLSCILMIHIAPGGTVLNVDLIKTSGDPVLDHSATVAVMKASPLPVPQDSALFEQFRSLRLTVHPS